MQPANTRSGSVIEIAVALLVIAASVGLRALLEPVFGSNYPFVTIFPAVVLIAWWRGLRAGMVAVAAGWIAGTYLFIEPRGSLLHSDARTWVATGIFVVLSSLIVLLAHRRL